jgi:hypothetical protein
MLIIEKIENLGKIETGKTVYIKDINISYHIYRDCMYIYDLVNAMKIGKNVIQYCLHAGHGDFDINHLLKTWSLEELLINPCEKVEFVGYSCSKRLIKGIKVFSPFADIPKKVDLVKKNSKITLADVKKCILNKQVEKIQKQNSYDNKNQDVKAIDFVKELIEEPNGWWCDNKFSFDKYGRPYLIVCCHNFNSNILYFNKFEFMSIADLLKEYTRLIADFKLVAEEREKNKKNDKVNYITVKWVVTLKKKIKKLENYFANNNLKVKNIEY